MNLSGYIPTHAKQPHLWQEALANFLGGAAGDVGKTAISAAMSPNATTDVAGNVSVDAKQPWYTTKATPQMQAQIESANASNQEARQRGGLYSAEADSTRQLTPAQIQSLLANTAHTAADTTKIGSMLPFEMSHMGAETGALNAGAGLTTAQTGQVAPNAASTRALQGTEGARNTADAGLIGAQAGQVAPNAAAGRALTGAQTAVTAAGVPNVQAETALRGQQLAQEQLRMQLMKQFMPKANPAQANPQLLNQILNPGAQAPSQPTPYIP